jgi:hypothetical protein
MMIVRVLCPDRSWPTIGNRPESPFSAKKTFPSEGGAGTLSGVVLGWFSVAIHRLIFDALILHVECFAHGSSATPWS